MDASEFDTGAMGQIRAEMHDLYRVAADEIERMRTELERERIRLAACGVVAGANTSESAAKARSMLKDYRSASCDDIAAAVDREMALRAEIGALRTRLEINPTYPYDGIACRDETIKQQNQKNDRLVRENAVLAGHIDRLVRENATLTGHIDRQASVIDDLRAEVEALREALKALIRGYVNTLEIGRDRIVMLGGQCDSVEQMKAGDPYLLAARAALAQAKDAEARG